ncbi:MAG: LPS export ABC transporter periplasmic protein LptC [Succinivibrio sp.]
MSVTKKSIILAVIFALLTSFVYVYSTRLNTDTQSDLEDYPTFVATDTEGVLYNDNGKIDKTFVSTKTTYFDEKTEYVFENPLVTHYSYKNNNDVELWHMKGEFGNMYTDKSATISKNVVIYPGFDGSIVEKAEAEYLYYSFKDNGVFSKDEVTIFGKGFKTTGTQFSLDLNKNVLKYKGKPNATYYPKSK